MLILLRIYQINASESYKNMQKDLFPNNGPLAFRKLVFIVIAFAGTSACTQLDTQKAKPNLQSTDLDRPINAKSQSSDQPLLVARRESGECLGECPSFVLSVYENREIVFDGLKNTKAEGEHRTKLSEDEFRSFVVYLDEMNLLGMSDEYTRLKNCSMTVLSDSPYFYFVYRNNDKTKEIKHYTGCYSQSGNLGRLLSLEARIEKLAVERNWIS